MTAIRRPARSHGSVDLPSFTADHSVPASASELAASAADSVRLLNHATVIVDVTGGPQAWPGYRTPADVSDTVASLKRAVQMLPQAFAQAERWLAAALATGLVGDDRQGLFLPSPNNDPAVGIAHARSDLHAATSAAELLAMNLGMAHAALTHLTYDLDDPADHDDLDDLDDLDDPDDPDDPDDEHDNDNHDNDAEHDGTDGGL